uniref:Vanin 3 n=2 Tax=Canis lupus familiaris TaxID=9615 RepID=A0A8I3MLY9_CANLF
LIITVFPGIPDTRLNLSKITKFYVSALDTFIAAVYEHAIILSKRTETPVPKEEALLLVNKSIGVLEKAVKLAAGQGTHIIVTPEDGIYGWVFTTETICPYLEDIPDPDANWISCRDPQS